MLQILLDHFRNMMKHILGCCNRRRLQFIHDTVIYKINIGIPNISLILELISDFIDFTTQKK